MALWRVRIYDWVQGVEDSRRNWEWNTLKQHLPCDSIKTAAESWATFPFSKRLDSLRPIRMGHPECRCHEKLTVLRSSVVMCLNLEALLHPASSRPGTLGQQCQISSQTEVRQWLVRRRILGSIERKGRPRVGLEVSMASLKRL
jgi:hypothetical protein